MPLRIKILMVEDTPTDAELVTWELKKAGIEPSVLRVETRQDFLHALESFVPDLILSDSSMPGFDGLSALRLAREQAPNTPFIFVSGGLREEDGDDPQRAVADYVSKTDLTRLAPIVQRALRIKLK